VLDDSGEAESVTRIPTSLRFVSIVEVLADHGAALSRAELTSRLGLPPQTVYRLCRRMEVEGLLSMDRSKRLHAGTRLRRICAGVLFDSCDHIARHQVLVKVARKTGETVNLVVPEAGGMRYIDRVETNWPYRVQLPIGTAVPFHCTASGKVYMASLPEVKRRHFINCLDLRQVTPHTKCKPDELLGELNDIAERGFALSREEFIESMHAAAVPVTDDSGRYLASLACHGPAQRMSIENAISFVSTMKSGARDLSHILVG